MTSRCDTLHCLGAQVAVRSTRTAALHGDGWNWRGHGLWICPTQ